MMEELVKVKSDISDKPSLEERVSNLEEEVLKIEEELVSIYEILKEIAGNK